MSSPSSAATIFVYSHRSEIGIHGQLRRGSNRTRFPHRFGSVTIPPLSQVILMLPLPPPRLRRQRKATILSFLFANSRL
ncbi:unnamed protein product [Cochlearia groenlandica]